MNNTEKFQTDVATLGDAGVGVVIVPTREPYRAASVLQACAIDRSVDYRSWNARDGWAFYPEDPDLAIEIQDKAQTVDKALRRIKDLDGDGSKEWKEGFFVMHYPHWTMRTSPSIVQCLKSYAEEFVEGGQRLFLLVPEGFQLGEELRHDIVPLSFELPAHEELKDALWKVIIETYDEEVDEEDIPWPWDEKEVETLCNNAGGMTTKEASTAFARCMVINRETWPETEFDTFNRELLKCKTDIVKRSKVLELHKTEDFDSVGGLDLFKEYIRVRDKAFSEEAQAFGVDYPKGFLAVGPPGTGKSLLGKATSGSLGLPMVGLDIGRLMGSKVGESEGNTRSALKQIEAMAPCIAFLDEVDKGLGGAHTGGGDSGVTKRVLGTILTFMQECEKPVYWIFTANRVGGLPPELLRKGRLDEIFCVTLPNIIERLEIIKIHLAKRGQNPENVEGLAEAAAECHGYVGSEIEAAVKEAILIAFTEDRPVTGEIISKQFETMKPLSEAFKDEMEEMAKWAAENARLTSSPCEDMEKVGGKKPARRRIQMDKKRVIRKIPKKAE